jgi:hypothetical protein
MIGCDGWERGMWEEWDNNEFFWGLWTKFCEFWAFCGVCKKDVLLGKIDCEDFSWFVLFEARDEGLM